MTLRRDFLAFTAGTVAARTVLPIGARAETPTPGSHPDAELIRLAGQFITNEQAIRAEPCDAEPGSPEEAQSDWRLRQMIGTQRVLMSQLDRLQATTADGIAARSRCLAVHNADLAFSMEDPDTTTGMLVRQIIRDAAPAGVSTVTAASPDAELLEACAAFDALERAYIAVPGNCAPGSPEDEETDAERDRISDAQGPLVERMCELRAVTREGQAARARSYALWDAELMKPQDDIEGLFTQAIVRDLIG